MFQLTKFRERRRFRSLVRSLARRQYRNFDPVSFEETETLRRSKDD